MDVLNYGSYFSPEPLRSSPRFRARVNRPADLKACICKAARLRLPSAGWRPFLPTAATQVAKSQGKVPLRTSRTGGRDTPFQRNAFFDGLRVGPRVPNRVPRRPISQSIRHLIIASARCRPARTQLMRPSQSSPAPFGSHCICPFVAVQRACGRCRGLISCSLQGPHCDPRGAGHVWRRMPRPDDTPR